MSDLTESLYCHRPCSWHPKCEQCQAADRVRDRIDELEAENDRYEEIRQRDNRMIERLQRQVENLRTLQPGGPR